MNPHPLKTLTLLALSIAFYSVLLFSAPVSVVAMGANQSATHQVKKFPFPDELGILRDVPALVCLTELNCFGQKFAL